MQALVRHEHGNTRLDGVPDPQVRPLTDAMNRRIALAVGLAALLLVAAPMARVPPALAGDPGPLSRLDANHDGRLDWNEVKQAADRRFTALGPSRGPHHDTLDESKTKAVLSTYWLGVSDPSNDRTMSRTEWQGYVQQRFRDTDKDHDGTLDQQELRTTAGKRLLRLLNG